MTQIAMEGTRQFFDKTGSWGGGVSYPATNGVNPQPIDPGWLRYGLFIEYLRGTETSLQLRLEVRRPGSATFFPLHSVNPESPTLTVTAPNLITIVGVVGATHQIAVPYCNGFWSGLQLFGDQVRCGVSFVGTPDSTTRVAVTLAPSRS